MAPSADVELPTELSKQYLDEIIKKELETEDYSCDITAGSAKGDNYVGVMYRATATKKTKQNGTTGSKKDLSLIIKLPPVGEARREQFFARPAFLREGLVYDKILPLFQKFQESKGVNPETDGGFYEVAKCYKVVTVEKEEGLYFDDLKAQGFEMFDRFTDATFEHVKLVMEALGKFHAISFAMKDQQPELIEPYKNIEEVWLSRGDKDPVLIEWFGEMSERSLKTLDPVKDAEVYQKIKKLYDIPFFTSCIKLVDGRSAEPHSVLTHGDCWGNNMLFKNQNGTPVDIRLLDWQVTRYSSPVLDLLYYIFACTTKTLRDKHYDDFIQIYHDSLSKLLKKLGSDPEKLFPFSALQDHLMRYGSFGALMAIILLPVITTDSADVPNLDEISEKMQNGEDFSDEMFKSPKNVELYNERMSDTLRDICRLGYVK